MHTVGKIDKDMYKCITEDIRTDEVIITDERIDHIKERHPVDYEKYGSYIPEIITNPDYIIRDKRPNTAMLLKEFVNNETAERIRLTLRLIAKSENSEYKNSILTFMYVHESEYKRIIENKEILYKKE